jgi:hypothetical protein
MSTDRKTDAAIEDRIRRLMWLQQKGFIEGSDPWYKVSFQISELRWVLGEMDTDSAGALIERVPNTREPIDIGPFYQP